MQPDGRAAEPGSARRTTAARVTIVDVARAAGVRPSTVSKALNDGRGSDEVRQRVTEAATRLGYRPNLRARGLRRAESRAIGLLIPDLANPGFLPFLRGVEQAARERGYVVLIADGQRSDEAEADALERFFAQGVDGLVLGGPVPAGGLRAYLDHGVPVAPSLSDLQRGLVGGWEPGEAAATRAMAARLYELGHRRFAFVTTPAPKGLAGGRYRRGRLGALAAYLTEAGGELTIVLVNPDPDGNGDGDGDGEPGTNAALGTDQAQADLRRLAADGWATALVCANHLLVPRLLSALHEAGVRLPDDVSLVVYGDSAWARAHLPALSVVRRDVYTEGHNLAMSLFDTLTGVTTPRPAPAPARYLERGSCGPAGQPAG